MNKNTSDLEYIGNACTGLKNLTNELSLVGSNIDHLNFLPLTKISLDKFVNDQHDICIENYDDIGQVNWDIFLPEKHFDKSYMFEIFKLCGIDSPDYCWITRVMPGKMLPPIQDFNKGFLRWHCHLSEKNIGQVIFVGDTTLYQEAIGNLYKWKDSDLTYSANNIGNEPQYFLNILTRI
jgi:hypothetical protein